MSELLTNLKNVGIATTVIALITIFVVGCLKLIPGLKNMKSKEGRKAVYQVLNLVIAGGLSVAYCYFMQKTGWTKEMLTFIGIAIAEVNALYPLYENLGLRALVKKIVSLLIPSKAKKADEVIDAVADIVEKPISSTKVAEKQKKAEKTGWLE